MESSLKNVTTILVILSAAFLGYYLFVEKGKSDLVLEEGGTIAGLFGQVQKYSERNRQLDRIDLNTDMLADERFRSLVGYSSETPAQDVGRANPFDQAARGAN